MSKQVTVMGVKYRSLSEACRVYDIDPSLVNSRIHHLNWDLEVAITTPTDSRTRPVVLDGKLYKSIKEVAIYYDINHHTLLQRLSKGWSLEEAITTPVRIKEYRRGLKLIIRGVQYSSIAQAARYYGIDPDVVYARLRYGWSPEEAVTTPLISKQKHKRTIIFK